MNKLILIIILIFALVLYFGFLKKEKAEITEPVEEQPSGLSIPMTGVKINEALCAPFLAFPDCSYASEQHQDLCKECRSK